MSEQLRAYDGNAARRVLHDLLFDVHFEFAIERSGIPHTYDTDELLAYAEKIIRRRDLRGTELHHQLVYRTAIAQCVVGSKTKGRELFEKGTRLSDYLPDQALFRYGIAHWVHQLNGGRHEAHKLLLVARRQSERGRHLRTEIDLLLGAIHTADGDGFAAQRRFERILDRGVLELRPMARLRNVPALLLQGLHEEAWQENERAREMIASMSDWRLHAAYARNKVHLLKHRGDYEKALRVQAKVLEANFRRLHLYELGYEYANYSLLCRRLGRLDEALEKGIEALRHAPLMPGRYPVRIHRNLALLLNDMGMTGEALAALDVALDISRRKRFRDYEFKSLVAAAQVLGGVDGKRIPALLARCQELLSRYGDDIPRQALVEYVEVTTQLGGFGAPATSRAREIKQVSSAADRQALADLMKDSPTPNYERELRSELGEGLAFDDAPEPGPLSRFLMLFSGDHFKSASYQREFGKSQPRAKYHLQWLVNNRILERLGTRKASTYILAFHRR